VVTHVSVATRARSSRWLPRVVRRNVASVPDQRPRTSQLLRLPRTLTPRTWTWTSVPAGVVAAHDGTSSVSPKPGRTHGEVQVPTR
jgi:hypothetical protein